MKKQKILGLAILTGGVLLAAFLFFNAVQAQETNIVFPVAELGNCANKQECKAFCDSPDNMNVCLDFAEKNNLIPKEEVERGRQFAKAGGTGPGGCRGRECENYCNDIDKIEECVAFAEKNNLAPANELAEMKKVRDAVKSGVKPPACRNKQECDTYCAAPDHMEECVTFASAAGLMPKDEGEKVLKALRQGIKPPACRGQEECDQYCSSEEHFEECFKFAEAAGFMKPEEAAMARKTGGKGPGGCRGRECETFCQNPNNQEACFNFAKENGLISEQELKEIEGHKQNMVQQFQQMPPEILTCLEQSLGADKVNQIKSGQGMPSREMGEQMRTCFEQNRDKLGPPPGQEGQQGQPGEFRSGPGGCQSPEECQAFCQNNPQECQGFGPQQGEMMNREEFRPMEQNGQFPQQQGEFRSGPGGCQSPEECQNFCQSNPDSCRDFGQQQGMSENGQQPMMRPENGDQRPPEERMIDGERYEFPNQQQMEGMIQRREGEQGPPAGGMPPEGFQGNMEQFRQQFGGQMPLDGQRPPEGFQQQMMNFQGQQPPEGFQQNFQPNQQMNFQGQQPPQNFQQQQPMMEFRPPEGGQQMPPPGGEGMMAPQGTRPANNFFSQILGVFTKVLRPIR